LLPTIASKLRTLPAACWTNERIQFPHDLVRGMPSGNLPSTEGFPRTIQGRQDFLSCAGDAAFCRANWAVASSRSIIVGETSDPYEHERLTLGKGKNPHSINRIGAMNCPQLLVLRPCNA